MKRFLSKLRVKSVLSQRGVSHQGPRNLITFCDRKPFLNHLILFYLNDFSYEKSFLRARARDGIRQLIAPGLLTDPGAFRPPRDVRAVWAA